MLIYFLQDFYDEIADQIFKLREQREKCTVDTAARDARIARINELARLKKEYGENAKGTVSYQQIQSDLAASMKAPSSGSLLDIQI